MKKNNLLTRHAMFKKHITAKVYTHFTSIICVKDTQVWRGFDSLRRQRQLDVLGEQRQAIQGVLFEYLEEAAVPANQKQWRLRLDLSPECRANCDLFVFRKSSMLPSHDDDNQLDL